jgi:uncharacterized repeat protein (TIGR01451 family)
MGGGVDGKLRVGLVAFLSSILLLQLASYVFGIVPLETRQQAFAQSVPVFVSEPVNPVVLEADLSEVPPEEPWQPGDPIEEAPGEQEPEPPEIGGPESNVISSALTTVASAVGKVVDFFDPQLPSASAITASLSTPSQNFDGIQATGFLPPDTVGDVGPSNYVQAVNTQFAIFDKNGNTLAGPMSINQLWILADTNDMCEANNDGDPIVQYDHLADRWLVSQFAVPPDTAGAGDFHECIAISQTSDPVAGGWFLYDFQSNVFPDYPKFGVWPDAYYMGTNAGYPTGHAWAFDRINMLAGSPATFIRFNVGGAFMLPSDLEGPAPPPGASNVFMRFVEGAEFGGVDRLQLAEFHADFGTPALSTFTFLPDLATAPFDSNLCGFGFRPQCIDQPGTGQLLDTLRGEPMYRLQYRNFGASETLVVNHSVDADGADTAGIRWYQLQKVGGVWSIAQQGDHSPDDTHRWMGSMSMDKFGNIALGYSVSSDSVFPGIRYAGRLATDPAGTMPQGEFTLVSGTASQPPIMCTNGPCGNRWGDYASMNVDPVDDCTFWFTSEYMRLYGPSPNWATRIGEFRFPDCGADISVEKTAGSDPAVAGEQLTYTVTVSNDGPNTADSVVVVDTLPPEVAYVGDTDSCVEAPAGTLTCDLGSIAPSTSADFDITVEVPADLVFGGTTSIENTVSATSNQFDPNTADNTVVISTAIVAEADLAITSFTVSSTPTEAVIGIPFEVTLNKTIVNNGPSSPVDVNVSVTTAASAGLDIDPAAAAEVISAVEIGDVSVFTESLNVTCTEPGPQEVTFTDTIAPVDGIDPDLSNNEADLTVQLECLIPVLIDIHPGSPVNPVNLKSGGIIPVAILSTDAGENGLPIAIDASMIDPLSVHFGPSDVLLGVEPPGGATETHGRGHLQAGDQDLILHFRVTETGLGESDMEACAKGQINIEGVGYTFFGCDVITLRP